MAPTGRLRNSGGRRPNVSRQVAGKKGRGHRGERFWNTTQISEYRKYLVTNGPKYVDTAFTSDCADLAISLLVWFAKLKSLPVSFEKRFTWSDLKPWNGAATTKFHAQYGSALSTYDTGRDYDKLLKLALQKFGAEHIFDVRKGNTVAIDRMKLLPGDLLAGEPHNAPGAMHVQVVLTSVNHQITLFDYKKAREIHKKGGDLNAALVNVKAVEILQGSQESDGSGTTISRKAWGVQSLDYYIPTIQYTYDFLRRKNVRVPKLLWTQMEHVGNKSPFGSKPGLLPRRWDFLDFNRVKRDDESLQEYQRQQMKRLEKWAPGHL